MFTYVRLSVLNALSAFLFYNFIAVKLKSLYFINLLTLFLSDLSDATRLYSSAALCPLTGVGVAVPVVELESGLGGGGGRRRTGHRRAYTATHRRRFLRSAT